MNITQKEKIEMLKNTIVKLYEKEGRSKSYISRLLEVDRKTLSNIINYKWKLKQAKVRYMKPSNKKFLNRNKNKIKSLLDKDVEINDIAKELGVDRHYLRRTIIYQDEVLSKALEDFHKRVKDRAKARRQKIKKKSSFNYNIKDKNGEKWKEILGYEGYYISNFGRVKKYIKIYDDYMLIELNINCNTNRHYIKIGDKGLQVARLVGFAFVLGHSEEKDTINHIDGNVENNHYENLEWVSQSENNRHAYKIGKQPSIPYSRFGRYKKIILNDSYEFKTINSLAKFLDKSPTQASRYITKETPNDNDFKFIY